MAQSAAIAPSGPMVPLRGDTRHVVQFYAHDDELADSVGSYLGDALVEGSAVVLIATAARQAACESRMTAAGADLGAATATAGAAYTALDAASLTRSFLAGDRDQPGGFVPVITDVLRRATAAGPAVVFGEIGARLWSGGHRSAAAELESLWNELARSYPFSLVCAHPAPGRPARLSEVARLDEAARLGEVTGPHSEVLGSAAPGSPASGPAAARSYLRSRGAPRAARHFVTGTLRQWGGPWDDAMLAVDAGIVATELATNAVLHARSDFTIEVAQRPGGLRISVRDSEDGGLPLMAAPGHGLAVLDKVAARWGAGPLAAGGKLVWAQLACPR